MPTKAKIKSFIVPCMQHIVQNFSLPHHSLPFPTTSGNIGSFSSWSLTWSQLNYFVWNLVIERLTFALELGWLSHQLHENHIKATQYGIYGNLITIVCNKDSWLKNSHDEKTADRPQISWQIWVIWYIHKNWLSNNEERFYYLQTNK